MLQTYVLCTQNLMGQKNMSLKNNSVRLKDASMCS